MAKKHIKMLTITNYREMPIKTTMKHHLTPSEWPSSKNLQTMNVVENVEKRESFYTVGGNINW